MTKKYCSIQLRGIELNLRLGWPDAERAEKQTVMADILLRFANEPKACKTDNLEDTYCYDTLIRMLVNEVEPREFHLLESLAHDMYKIIRSIIPDVAAVKVSILKKPAIDKLTGGVVFSYGDEEY